MIKQSTYIRSFKPAQCKLLEKIGIENDLKTIPAILFYCLENHLDQRQEIQRLKRIIEYKQKKIDAFRNE